MNKDKKKLTYIIYMVTNLINNKIYIGQTIKPLKKRISNHISDSKTKKSRFYNAIRKHNIENFKWKIIFKCKTINMLNAAEIFFISYYDSINRKTGYNSTLGGMGVLGFIVSNKTKEKISKTLTGRPLSEEHKQKIADAHIGKKHTKEVLLKISKNHADVSGIDNPMYGKKHSKETIQLMIENNPNTIAVIINDKYYKSINAAAKALDMPRITIQRGLKANKPGYKYANN